MKQIAIYGKGGIGKSTVASHLSYAFADRGLKVLQVGCDPKGDSTHSLLNTYAKPILDVLAHYDFDRDSVQKDEILFRSTFHFEGGGALYCAEAGGPEPGIGCAGKGVVEAIETLSQLRVADSLKLDVTIYDILGDVVCGGFSMPIRNGFAKETYLVTSGELEALYQVTNVCSAIRRFAPRSGAKLGGLIVNLRGIKQETKIVHDFADRLGTQVVGIQPFSQLVKECSGKAETVFTRHGDSAEAERYRALAEKILDNRQFVVPQQMSFEELYQWWSNYVS